MSTRAMIGYMNDKKVTAIYSHWDGYPTGLGMNLLKFYGNPRRVLHLIEGGDTRLSTLSITNDLVKQMILSLTSTFNQVRERPCLSDF